MLESELPRSAIPPLVGSDREELVRSLPDTPGNAELLGALLGGRARVFAEGGRGAWRAALVDNRWDPNEPIAVGTDAGAIWSLLRRYAGWTCVGGLARPVAEALAVILATQLHETPRFKAAITFVLDGPAIPRHSSRVRRLGPHDADLIDRAPPELRGPFVDGADLFLRAHIAAAIVDGRIVGWMTSSGRTPKHDGVGGHVLEPWRDGGLGSAAAFLVAREIQRSGRAPVWSTGEDNASSQHVARRLGFRVTGRDWYVIAPGLEARGGFAP